MYCLTSPLDPCPVHVCTPVCVCTPICVCTPVHVCIPVCVCALLSICALLSMSVFTSLHYTVKVTILSASPLLLDVLGLIWRAGMCAYLFFTYFFSLFQNVHPSALLIFFSFASVCKTLNSYNEA